MRLDSFTKRAQPSDKMQQVSSEILKVVSGLLPDNAARELIDEKVELVISNKTYHGIGFWYHWLNAVRACKAYDELLLVPKHFDTKGNIVTIQARFIRVIEKTPYVSNDIVFRHWIEGGKVKKMSTQWENYEFHFGRIVNYKLLRPALFLKLVYYSRFKKKKATLPQS